ncbi:hypothetical protein IW245_004282 [Longispora fulva]|uniref:Uncharacterized protein n=1 Tax=Longispora fulva TaxID=619741 RepID=A0A8J7GTI8_9ACTN|nr:hypothetical protein [Longispora fulva]
MRVVPTGPVGRVPLPAFLAVLVARVLRGLSLKVLVERVS